MPGEPGEHKHHGMGYHKVQKNGKVHVGKGDLRVLRKTGEDVAVDKEAQVNVGDLLYWTAECHFTLDA
jgi:hypothetical protein